MSPWLTWVFSNPTPLSPLSLPLSSIHHNKPTNDKNFGGYRFWDWLCGTGLHSLETGSARLGGKFD